MAECGRAKYLRLSLIAHSLSSSRSAATSASLSLGHPDTHNRCSTGHHSEAREPTSKLLRQKSPAAPPAARGSPTEAPERVSKPLSRPLETFPSATTFWDTNPGRGILKPMDRVANVFSSFADAERADHEYYASLKPSQRVDILLDLIEHHRSSLGPAAERFERVCRIAQLSER
jgi:hypothetical protein